eukprot:NODE_13776_length_1147_cov_5.905882.p3 GENE.NODE_13776_length_1147_cov_5.905882~~NODE_13776_length_1147_cov_5.905882.p3  ORF type:complete len:113 (-),score=18.27 NODE_13776_length_1147_cov_5.905882:284-622(-)
MLASTVLDQLTSLNLTYNRLADRGAEVIANALHRNTTLTALCLGQNHIGDAGAEAILEMLRHNTALETFLFDGNAFSDEAAAAIENVFNDPKLRGEALNHNESYEDGVILAL